MLVLGACTSATDCDDYLKPELCQKGTIISGPHVPGEEFFIEPMYYCTNQIHENVFVVQVDNPVVPGPNVGAESILFPIDGDEKEETTEDYQ